ncbi:MAG TPA: protein kinase, partial [Kofleriaceae bacterium]|nr:protein kinase [Kofleriaceae bacterium]
MSTPRRSNAPQAAFPGTRRFEVRRVLGEGGMGIVYEAFDHDRQMPVALKSLRWVDAQSIFLLKTEFRARADLEHRNLVRLGELHRDEGHWFFTMELVHGVDFLEWVRSTEAPPDASGE